MSQETVTRITGSSVFRDACRNTLRETWARVVSAIAAVIGLFLQLAGKRLVGEAVPGASDSVTALVSRASLGAVVGAGLTVLALFLWNLWRAPFRLGRTIEGERDDALKKLKEAQEALNKASNSDPRTRLSEFKRALGSLVVHLGWLDDSGDVARYQANVREHRDMVCACLYAGLSDPQAGLGWKLTFPLNADPKDAVAVRKGLDITVERMMRDLQKILGVVSLDDMMPSFEVPREVAEYLKKSSHG